jgi:hypothetical protein
MVDALFFRDFPAHEALKKLLQERGLDANVKLL